MPYDLVVVGAGILGAVTAYLACFRNPKWRVLLIDRSRVASGATRYSAGLATVWGETTRKRTLAARSSALYAAMTSDVHGVQFVEQPVVWFVREPSVGRFLSYWEEERPDELTWEQIKGWLTAYDDFVVPAGTRFYLDRRARWGGPAAIAAGVGAAWVGRGEFVLLG